MGRVIKRLTFVVKNRKSNAYKLAHRGRLAPASLGLNASKRYQYAIASVQLNGSVFVVTVLKIDKLHKNTPANTSSLAPRKNNHYKRGMARRRRTRNGIRHFNNSPTVFKAIRAAREHKENLNRLNNRVHELKGLLRDLGARRYFVNVLHALKVDWSGHLVIDDLLTNNNNPALAKTRELVAEFNRLYKNNELPVGIMRRLGFAPNGAYAEAYTIRVLKLFGYEPKVFSAFGREDDRGIDIKVNGINIQVKSSLKGIENAIRNNNTLRKYNSNVDYIVVPSYNGTLGVNKDFGGLRTKVIRVEELPIYINGGTI